MTNRFVSRSMAASLCAAGVLMLAATLAPVASAQQGDGGGGAQHRASAASGSFHMWWNSENYIIRAKLGAEVRGQLDAVWEAHKASAAGAGSDEFRKAFNNAASAGDWPLAEKQLTAWVDAERASFQARGDLVIATLSLLSPAQRTAVLEAGGRSFLRQPWRAKMNWGIRGAKAMRK